MSEGKIAAQCVHAALGLNKLVFESWLDPEEPLAQSAIEDVSSNGDSCFDYLDPMLSVVVLQVSDAKFEEAKAALVASEDSFHVVHDAGYTEVAPGTETVLCFLEDDPRGQQ